MVTHQFWQIHNISNVLKKTLSDNEPPRKRLLGLFLDNLFQHIFQVVHIIVFKPTHSTSTDLDAFSNRKVDGLVRDNDVTSLTKTRYHTADGRERLGIDDASRHAQVCGNISLGLHVYILGAVEAGGTTGADAVCAEGLYGFLLERFRGEEVVEVVGSEVRNGAAVGELGFGS